MYKNFHKQEIHTVHDNWGVNEAQVKTISDSGKCSDMNSYTSLACQGEFIKLIILDNMDILFIYY